MEPNSEMSSNQSFVKRCNCEGNQPQSADDAHDVDTVMHF